MENTQYTFSYVRFFNAAPGGGNVDFYINGALTESNVSFGNFTKFYRIPVGNTAIKITPAGQPNNVLDSTIIEILRGEVFTIAANNIPNNIELEIINEPRIASNPNAANIRVCHLSPDAGNVDVLINDIPILKEVQYQDISNYIQVVPNSYTFKVRVSDTDDIALTVPNQNLQAGKFYTLYIIGLAKGTPSLTARLSVDAGSYTNQYL